MWRGGEGVQTIRQSGQHQILGKSWLLFCLGFCSLCFCFNLLQREIITHSQLLIDWWATHHKEPTIPAWNMSKIQPILGFEFTSILTQNVGFAPTNSFSFLVLKNGRNLHQFLVKSFSARIHCIFKAKSPLEICQKFNQISASSSRQSPLKMLVSL